MDMTNRVAPGSHPSGKKKMTGSKLLFAAAMDPDYMLSSSRLPENFWHCQQVKKGEHIGSEKQGSFAS
jgi:hypothetical protein